jgi:hypothetical protein
MNRRPAVPGLKFKSVPFRPRRQCLDLVTTDNYALPQQALTHSSTGAPLPATNKSGSSLALPVLECIDLPGEVAAVQE